MDCDDTISLEAVLQRCLDGVEVDRLVRAAQIGAGWVHSPEGGVVETSGEVGVSRRSRSENNFNVKSMLMLIFG